MALASQVSAVYLQGMTSTGWSRVWTADGSWTLRAESHGEACHSLSGAWAEARSRYAEACRLAPRARGGGQLHLLDVGLGIGWNVAAALEAVEGTPARLEVLSLESDPTVLAAALEGEALGEDLPGARYLSRVREALVELLGNSRPTGPVSLGGPHRLQLFLGDARQTLAQLPLTRSFDAVFLDPFSPAKEPALWQCPFLRQIARRMAPGSLLSTYSASFSVRLALQDAGLRVGLGRSFGAKREGTLASPDLELPELSDKVQRRLRAESSAGGGPGWVFGGSARE